MKIGASIMRFLKDWTLPVAIVIGTVCYLPFGFMPALDETGTVLGRIIDIVFPVTLFLTLFVTFCKVDFHQMRFHRWHFGVLMAQVVLVAANIGLIFWLPGQKLLWEAVLTCIIGPSAVAAPVVVGKMNGNISTMTTYTLLSSFASSLMIPAVFPILEPTADVAFLSAFLVILEKMLLLLMLPLLLGWFVQHYAHRLACWIASIPDLNFYLWSVSLAITTGVTVKNIVHSEATLALLFWIALGSLLLCWLQFLVGHVVGTHFGELVNSRQALFQKNTGLSIWVAYMYLNPVSSIGAGCYVLWQNIINSLELWQYRKKGAA